MHKKTILINASNILAGGAKTYLEWFLYHKKEFNFNLKFLINRSIKTNLYNSKDIFYTNLSPSKSLLTRKKILILEKKINPDLIFTLFGPAYVNFKKTHLMGVGDGWVFENKFKIFLQVYKKNFIEILKKKIEIIYKRYYFKKADFYFTESKNLKNKVINAYNIDESKIYVVKNLDPSTVYPFKNQKKSKKLKKKFIGYKNFKYVLYLTNYRKHKNFEYIFELYKELKKNNQINVKFILTLKDEEFIKLQKKYGVKKKDSAYFVNLGPINFYDIKNIYNYVDITILPSFIETFSSNIIESITNNKVILLSDILNHKIEFKKNFEYLNLNNIKITATRIKKILNNKKIYNKILRKQSCYLNKNKINRIELFNRIFFDLTAY
jgi:hypothetical protein